MLNINPGKVLRIIAGMILFTQPFNNEAEGQTRESLIKAGYVEKFTHFVQWPGTVNNKGTNKKLVVAFLGKSEIYDPLNSILTKSASGTTGFEIIQVNNLEQLKNCDILFISGTEKNSIEKILEFTSGKPILTVSDTKGFGEKGVIINMFQDGNYIRYEINKAALEKSGLTISSMLLNYAVILKTNG